MLLIMGCTAGGKGKLAFELARRVGGEILSVDSMKVYRRLDIGSAKPGSTARKVIRHHLIDVVEPFESFSLGRYVELADAAIKEMRRRSCPVIGVGGTALYIRGLLEGIFDGPAADMELRDRLKAEAAEEGGQSLYERLGWVDAAAAERLHPNDTKRIIRALEVYELTGKPISLLQRQFHSGNYRHDWRLIGLRRDTEAANRRINGRVKKMLEAGLVGEVASLLAEPKGLSPQAAQALGYAEIIEHLQGKLSLAEAIEKIKINTRRFAKRQRTWFRSFRDVTWFDVNGEEDASQLAERVTKRLKL